MSTQAKISRIDRAYAVRHVRMCSGFDAVKWTDQFATSVYAPNSAMDATVTELTRVAQAHADGRKAAFAKVREGDVRGWGGNSRMKARRKLRDLLARLIGGGGSDA